MCDPETSAASAQTTGAADADPSGDADPPGESDRRPVFYGRRKGRPLRRQRETLLETLLPRLRVELPPPGGWLDPASLVPGARDLWLEIGFGGGEHLADQASAHPQVGFVGCEPFVNGVANLLQHVDARGLENIRIHPDDARLLLDALPDASVGRAFILFADPWPKLRHAQRRFVGPENLPRLARVLKDGAELRLATDDMRLARWMLEHTWRHPAFDWTARAAADWRSRPADWPPTRYEQKAVEAGRHPVYLRFRRTTR